MATDNGKRKFGLFVAGAKVPTQTWDGDYIKLVKGKVEIYRHVNGALSGTLVAVVGLEKGQNVSEITDAIIKAADLTDDQLAAVVQKDQISR
jgi:hypothetical protein